MGRIEGPKRIRTEDFKSEDRDLVNKLSSSINSFMDSVYNVLNNNLDFANLNRQLLTVDVRMDGGSPPSVLSRPQVKFTLRGRPVGINCINAINLDNSLVYPETAPFISFTFNDNIITLLSVTGLQANSQYRLTLELIGENV